MRKEWHSCNSDMLRNPRILMDSQITPSQNPEVALILSVIRPLSDSCTALVGTKLIEISKLVIKIIQEFSNQEFPIIRCT